MVLVSGFKVDLVLKSGGTVHGTVKKCVDKSLTLDNVDGLNDQVFAGGDIKELKVVDIPYSLKRKKNKNEKTKAIKLKENNTNSSNTVYDSTFGTNIESIKQSTPFDFAQSTADFNKQSALQEFEDNDTIDSSLRLAGHNKNRVKLNYEHTENVLNDPENVTSIHTNNKPNVDLTASDALKSLLNVKKVNNEKPSKPTNFTINGKNISLATPLQLSQVEQITESTYKYPTLLTNETVATGITSVVVHSLKVDGTILVAVGNNRTGSRGLATARKLINHGKNVLIFSPVDLNALNEEEREEEEEEMDPQVEAQLKLLKSIGETTIINSLETLKEKETNIVMAIDALQGYDTNITDCCDSELLLVTEFIDWMNQQTAEVVSLDIPSGIDAGSGSSTTKYVSSSVIISQGLVMSGVVHSYENGLIKNINRHFLVDLGIPGVVFTKGKGGLRRLGDVREFGELQY